MESNEKKPQGENLISPQKQEAIEEKIAEIVKKEDALSNAVEAADRINNQVAFQISAPLASLIETFNQALVTNILPKVNVMVNSMTKALVSAVTSPFMEWLRNIDYSALLGSLEEFAKVSDKYKELNEIYLNAMYECQWFPYAAWISDLDLFTEVIDIISSSRGVSKRREKRIDKAIFSYYTDKEIKNIKRTWKDSDLEPHIKKILGQAIEAHLRSEYVLTTTCLATMWEGLIHKRLNITERLGSKKTKEEFKGLIDYNDFDPIFSEFYEDFIVCECNSPEEVIEGIPNRNGISHSKYKKYPNKKASLNAILLTDFIIGLKPKEMEKRK